MDKQSPTGLHLKVTLFMAVCSLILLVASLVRGEFVVAAIGAIGLASAFESYRWYKQMLE